MEEGGVSIIGGGGHRGAGGGRPSTPEQARLTFFPRSASATSSARRTAHLKALVGSLRSDAAYFKRVYRYAFAVGKEVDQRALSLENALVYWGMLFSAPGLEWRSPSHDWLDLWKSYLGERWTRSVNRDMWNMTLEFAMKSMEDETLGFWSEDGAWPSVIDEFVAWCRERGVGKGEGMEVE